MAEKCHVCGEPVYGGIISSPKTCEICGRYTCDKHLKDKKCSICREKL